MVKVVMGVSDEILDYVGEVFKANPSGWLGPLFVAVCLDFLLLGTLFHQVNFYRSHFAKDFPWIKRLVGLLVALCIAKAVGSFLVVWDRNIVGFGNWRATASIPWNMWIELPSSALTSTVAQTFFVWRAFTLTGRNWYLLSILVPLMLTVLGLSIASAVHLAVDPFYLPPLATLYPLMYICSVVVDLAITAVVSYQLIRSKRGFSSRTDTMLARMLAITWESAAPPAISQVVMLTLFFTTGSKNTWYSLLIHLTPRLYTFSLMHTLNARADIRAYSSQGTSGHEVSPDWAHSTRGKSHDGNVMSLSRLDKKNRFNSTGTMPMPVHVQTETIVHTSSMDENGNGRGQPRPPRGGRSIEIEVHKLKSAPKAKEEDDESLDSSRWESSEKTAKEADAQVVHPYARYQPGDAFPMNSNV